AGFAPGTGPSGLTDVVDRGVGEGPVGRQAGAQGLAQAVLDLLDLELLPRVQGQEDRDGRALVAVAVDEAVLLDGAELAVDPTARVVDDVDQGRLHRIPEGDGQGVGGVDEIRRQGDVGVGAV